MLFKSREEMAGLPTICGHRFLREGKIVPGSFLDGDAGASAQSLFIDARSLVGKEEIDCIATVRELIILVGNDPLKIL